LKATGVHASRAFAEQHPEAVRAYIRALLLVHRAIRANPAELQNGVVKFLGLDPKTAETIAQAYLARNLWDSNGGLTPADVQYSIDFFTKAKSVPEGLTVEGVADLSYLNAVLDEIGRK
jgi:ABC-type nitrate/sulfonate/bicarbonate transport system substrate-binding protein